MAEEDPRRGQHGFKCVTCNEWFSRPVWECPGCGHHNALPEDAECGNCHVWQIDEQGMLTPLTVE